MRIKLFTILLAFISSSAFAGEKDKYFARQCYKSLSEEWEFSDDNLGTKLAPEYEYWGIKSNDDKENIIEKLGAYRIDVRIQVVFGWGEKKKQVRRCQLDEAGNVVLYTIKKGFDISEDEAGK